MIWMLNNTVSLILLFRVPTTDVLIEKKENYILTTVLSG